MCVWAVLVVFLMFSSTVQADTGSVTFWRTEVTLTCPSDDQVTWYDGTTKVGDGKKQTLEYKQTIKYHCKYKKDEKDEKETKYFFYVKGKTCEDCYELDARTFLMIIIVDVIGTAFLMILIFKCTKKNQDPAASKRSTSSGSRPPPAAPLPDYEQLNPRTRATDTYSTVVNRMG